MKKVLVFAVILLVFAIGFLATRTKTKQAPTVAPTKVEAPAKSVKELQTRYASVELTPTQQKLVSVGLSPTETYSVTINR
ncbi:MAG: hypothetical protein V1690_02990 [Candidatus Moraniibacteriota bacterium]